MAEEREQEVGLKGLPAFSVPTDCAAPLVSTCWWSPLILSLLPPLFPSLSHARPSTCKRIFLFLQGGDILQGKNPFPPWPCTCWPHHLGVGSCQQSGRPRIFLQPGEAPPWRKSWLSSGVLRLLGCGPHGPPQSPYLQAALKFGDSPGCKARAAAHGTPSGLDFP